MAKQIEVTAKNSETGEVRKFPKRAWDAISLYTSKGNRSGWVEIEDYNTSRPKEVKEAEDNQLAEMNKEQLLAVAHDLGIDIDGRSSKSTIIKKIEEKNG